MCQCLQYQNLWLATIPCSSRSKQRANDRSTDRLAAISLNTKSALQFDGQRSRPIRRTLWRHPPLSVVLSGCALWMHVPRWKRVGCSLSGCVFSLTTHLIDWTWWPSRLNGFYPNIQIIKRIRVLSFIQLEGAAKVTETRMKDTGLHLIMCIKICANREAHEDDSAADNGLMGFLSPRRRAQEDEEQYTKKEEEKLRC